MERIASRDNIPGKVWRMQRSAIVAARLKMECATDVVASKVSVPAKIARRIWEKPYS